jgi:hypothetical protein
MEEKKSYRAIFRQKKDEVHTPKEILQAFGSSFAACFALAEDCTPGARMQLFGKIWDINPDAIIVEADLFGVQSDPVAVKNQYLVICKNGTKESNALLAQCLGESGVITSPWYIQSKKQGGIKTCYRYVSGNNKPAVLHKANLLIDGDDLLLSVRHLSTADHARLKAEEST